MLIDGTYGREALFRAADHPFWIGRPVEEPGSRPLDFEVGGDLGAKLVEWPVAHTIKCLCFYHPDDPPELKARQERELLRLHDAARTHRARTPGRDHRQQARPGRDRHGRARRRAPLRARHQAGLVEARAAGQTRPPGAPSPRRSRRTIPIAAASCCSASRRRSTNSKPPSRSPRGAAGQGLCGRPHDLQRGRARQWFEAAIDDEAAIDRMAARVCAFGRALAARPGRRRARRDLATPAA